MRGNHQKLLPLRGRTSKNRRDGVLLSGPGVPGEGQEPANQQGTSGMHRLSPLCAHSLGRGKEIPRYHIGIVTSNFDRIFLEAYLCMSEICV